MQVKVENEPVSSAEFERQRQTTKFLTYLVLAVVALSVTFILVLVIIMTYQAPIITNTSAVVNATGQQ